MSSTEDSSSLQLQRLQSSIRSISHDIGNHLGILRMTVYHLQSGGSERQAQEHLFRMIGDSVEKIAAGLAALRALGGEDRSGEKKGAPGTGEDRTGA